MVPTAAEVICDPHNQTCIVIVIGSGTPGGSSDAGDTGTARVCTAAGGATVPCFSEAFGWFNDVDGCYYDELSPQPDPSNPMWEGHYPDGAIYAVTCGGLPFGGSAGGWVWRATPPPGSGDVGITPAQMAQRAVDQMRLAGPAIRLTISSDEMGLVGIPVWLWTEVTPTTWGPNSATASVPGLSVTARAQATQIVWDMGDGHTRVCTGPGTPYTEGAVHSPTCEYIYERSSAGQPGDAYPVTATTTWQVTWAGGGTSGSLTVTRTSTTTVRIGELQVLVTG
ncbi:ATP/GTP-binding protein [Actinotalea ferrariae]|uniref:hypothetical protein n=1 Tax=Actinotalea ferrariae TaxID=1386098 RepID=UPI001C8BDAB1|nr:hypothetical protein [Actinotalea ferrariae]MBX9243812.1 ATP/GTP-binding protein [Actinotalea ferrariae]